MKKEDINNKTLIDNNNQPLQLMKLKIKGQPQVDINDINTLDTQYTAKYGISVWDALGRSPTDPHFQGANLILLEKLINRQIRDDNAEYHNIDEIVGHLGGKIDSLKLKIDNINSGEPTAIVEEQEESENDLLPDNVRKLKKDNPNLMYIGARTLITQEVSKIAEKHGIYAEDVRKSFNEQGEIDATYEGYKIHHDTMSHGDRTMFYIIVERHSFIVTFGHHCNSKGQVVASTRGTGKTQYLLENIEKITCGRGCHLGKTDTTSNVLFLWSLPR